MEFPPNLNQRIGIAIRRLRQLERMSQAQLAGKAEITQGYVSMIENGNANQRINLNTLQRVSCALDLALSELIALAEKVPPLEQTLKEILAEPERSF